MKQIFLKSDFDKIKTCLGILLIQKITFDELKSEEIAFFSMQYVVHSKSTNEIKFHQSGKEE